MVDLVFIFSLPRSGSTLLQRVLMNHEEIAATAEPWILLPLIYSTKKTGVLTEYSHLTSQQAIEGFISTLPDKEKDYKKIIGDAVINLYEKQCRQGEKYFLDKTPRYYFVINEISKLFPDAKFIFLFRNVMHVYASAIKTWESESLKKVYRYDSDLRLGPLLLAEGYEKFKDKSYCLQYEEFVVSPEKKLQEICEYLGIVYSKSLLNISESNGNDLSFGDPTGVKEYNEIDKAPLNKWSSVFNTAFRKKMLIKYIKTLDNKIFTIGGYSREKMLEDVALIKIKKLGVLDLVYWFYAKLVLKFSLQIVFAKGALWIKGRYLS